MHSRRIVPVDGPLDARVVVPGSKSIANRALVAAALADGDSVLRGVPTGDDSEAMIDCLGALGLPVVRDGDDVHVVGKAGRLAPTGEVLRSRLAGTTSRFVTALAALADVPVLVDGEPPLRARPMAELHAALSQLGATVRSADGSGGLPVTVHGPLGGAGRAHVAIRGDVSSQYITALMLIAPMLPEGIDIRITSPLVSRPYLGITAAVMAAFGHHDVHVGDDRVTVGPGRYTACDYTVEPDASSASYPLAAAAMVGGRVHVPGLTATSLQGDAAFADVLARMGCDVQSDAQGTTVSHHGPLRGIDVNMVDISDTVPTLAVVAACAASPTVISGVGFIRRKESDRLSDLCAELRRTDLEAIDDPDGLTVRPGPMHGATLSTHHDHRLAMSFGVLGLVVPDIEVLDPSVVSKSWPDFWTMIEELR
jgi:3-phosphoshikimate 1-carboxyvinyltransferase